MNQRKLVGASLVAATCLGLLLAGFAAARLGLWAGGWSGAGRDDAADALARWLTVALVAALFAWLGRAALDLRRELAGRLDTLADEVGRRLDQLGREQAFQRERLARLGWRPGWTASSCPSSAACCATIPS